MPLETVLVVTSIAQSSHPILQELAATSLAQGVRFILVGDSPSPADFLLHGCDFYSIQSQLETGFRLAQEAPKRHYSRKNIGYLIAIRQGARVIVETDDDTRPSDGFWSPRSFCVLTRLQKERGWNNVYKYFSTETVWPRGFPLDRVREPIAALPTALEDVGCPIQQGLIDGSPDVDAVWRLTSGDALDFEKRAHVALGPGVWCPFNSQNTTWFEVAFPLLFLPSFCTFRMTDIWRSFVAQRICWENGWHLCFHSPTARQERNAHDLMDDFLQEIPGYLHNSEIASLLEGLSLRSGRDAIEENLTVCYEALVRAGHLPADELNLLEAWLEDLANLRVKC